MLLIHRVLDDPDHKADAQMVATIEQVRDNAYQGKKDSALSPARHQALDEEFAGMTPDELHAYVNNFMDTVQVKGFEGMTYGESFYKPMCEVVDYLQANEFQVYIVSASEREVVRGVVERLGIEPNRVIAGDIAYTTTKMGSTAPEDYTMEQDESVVLSTPSIDDCAKAGKVLAIAREIGKKPTLAFGNSSGDYAMLNYAEANGGMACYVVADDTTREYGDAAKAEEEYRLVEDESWTAFSMASDWATIYGQGVTKTELPGPVSQELAPAA
jgi:phosphoserine phosphatase